MRFILSVFFLLTMSSFSQATTSLSNEEQLRLFCIQQNGTLTYQWTCPLTGEVRNDGPFCTIRDNSGHLQVTNGCTDTYGVGSQFFKACVLHDFCYHNHALLDGKSKAGCDSKLLTNMYDICDQENALGYSRYDCYLLARDVFYEGVRHFGDNSWNCSNTATPYPHTLREITSFLAKTQGP